MATRASNIPTHLSKGSKPSAGHEFLGAFIGKWQTEGQTIQGPFGAAAKISGTDTYEWLPGGYFVIHKVDVRIGEVQVDAIEVIGYDEINNTYPTYSFDNQGNTNKYELRVKNSTWTFLGESERATVTVSENSLTANWERINNNSWLPWMMILLTRITN